jgi:hypothetical protein
MALILDMLAAIIFVASSGLLFNERFRKNLFLLFLASLLAMTSTFFLIGDIISIDVHLNIKGQIYNKYTIYNEVDSYVNENLQLFFIIIIIASLFLLYFITNIQSNFFRNNSNSFLWLVLIFFAILVASIYGLASTSIE